MSNPEHITIFVGGQIRRCWRKKIPSCIIDPTIIDDENILRAVCKKYWHLFLCHIVLIRELKRFVRNAKLRKWLQKVESDCFHYLYNLKHIRLGKMKCISCDWNNLLEAHNHEIVLYVSLERIIVDLKEMRREVL